MTLTGPEMAQTNVYNGLDTRVGSTTNSVANTYLRNGAYVTAPVIKDSNATFTPGVSERRGTTTTFSHSGLKNADVQSSVSQAVNATQQYDAFGNLASSTGTWQGQFGYGGGFGYQQDATGLKLLGHRYYDSSTGRFLTRDPIKDGRNWYVYCAGDPVGFKDFTGLAPSGLRGPLATIAYLYPPDYFTSIDSEQEDQDEGDEIADELDDPFYVAFEELGEMYFEEALSGPLPPGAGAVVGVGTTVLGGGLAAGKGSLVFGGWRARIEAALDGDVDTASGSGSEAWRKRYVEKGKVKEFLAN